MGVTDTSDNGFCHPTLGAQIENLVLMFAATLDLGPIHLTVSL